MFALGVPLRYAIKAEGSAGMKVPRRKVFASIFAGLALAVTITPAFADAPGPGDKQCRGATGNDNPHCPPTK